MSAVDLPAALDRLGRQAQAIAALVRGLPDAAMRAHPEPGRWSMLEVLAHLADEEREDFRARLDLILHRPDAPGTPIDPERWVVDRRYAERDPAAVLADFLAERERSLAWLRSLEAPRWDRAFDQPPLPPLSATDVLASWMAHDLLHLRQLARLLYGTTGTVAGGGSPAYAGTW